MCIDYNGNVEQGTKDRIPPRPAEEKTAVQEDRFDHYPVPPGNQDELPPGCLSPEPPPDLNDCAEPPLQRVSRYYDEDYVI
jgi:hypothetical protein